MIKIPKKSNLTVKLQAIKNIIERDQAIIKEFECPVCLSYAAPPIMMCKSSHVICNECFKKCYSCPTCRVPKSLTRAYTLEIFYPFLTFPCQYDGCSFQSNGGFTPIHEQSCFFYPVICPLSDSFKCTWRGPIGHTKKHLFENHKANVYFEPSVNLMSKELSSRQKSNYAMIFCCYERIFRFTLEYDESKSSDVIFNMVEIGSRANPEKFRYTVTFYNFREQEDRTHKTRCITMSSYVSKGVDEPEDINQNQRQNESYKWSLCYNHLVTYCTSERGDLIYKVVLQKSHGNIKKRWQPKYHFYRC